SHDHSRSRAYRWGEDGIAGISDDRQLLCFAPAFWNGRDPIIKERLFGLTGNEGNHGEDVKEYYYHLDNTPTHSYMKMLYKYPHAPFPYSRLVEENRDRGRDLDEFELIDTGVFDADDYSDLFVEYAKAAEDDILIRITAVNRGSEARELHLLAQLWFRNTWSWHPNEEKPGIRAAAKGVEATRSDLGRYRLVGEGGPELLFCENETNVKRLFGADQSGYFKDGINDYLVAGARDAVNPEKRGTKAALHYRLNLPPGGGSVIRLRLTRLADSDPNASQPISSVEMDRLFERRVAEADEFYDSVQEGITDPDERLIQRQALAGLLWSKQFYRYDVSRWLSGDPGQPTPPDERLRGRNRGWTHLNNADVISMPDTWEYPWYASWDLAFHTIALSLVDTEFAKHQLVLLTHEWYMHPDGQLPAYEWSFGDVNPPVHAWAAWRVFQIDRKRRGDEGDLTFLERVFHKLLLNFTWWVNRKDPGNRNVFEGGFLGLDNIGVFDRSAPLPTGGFINQADATSWMAMYSLNLMRISLELAQHNHVYEDIATKFFEHFLSIAKSMSNIGSKGISLWDEEDGFYYDVLSLPGDRIVPMKLKSAVGLIPLFAVETLEPELLEAVPEFRRRMQWFLDHRPDLASLVSRWHEPGHGDRRLLSLLRGHRMKALLRRMLDETQFLSEFGVRSLSKEYADRPYRFDYDGTQTSVSYEPGESRTGTFGGNSNWRGPIWFPLNYLLIESLQKFHHYYGDDFKVECPTGSGRYLTILEVAEELTRRLTRLYRADKEGKRPFAGQYPRMQKDPLFRDHLAFFEYFHGDSGRGVGASHQTGWTALIAKLLQPRR
ncbi:MAG TPA: glucosidase, partial [Spirochaetia bacterium]|nr:glucosidase [Spirochaetia bacterium]